MPLAAGTRLGSYEILAPIGEDGMGEVYRATDTKLKREVALTVLPDAFANDPERMARFQREAEVLAPFCGLRPSALAPRSPDGFRIAEPGTPRLRVRPLLPEISNRCARCALHQCGEIKGGIFPSSSIKRLKSADSFRRFAITSAA